jgi:hypothetical protein
MKERLCARQQAADFLDGPARATRGVAIDW